MWGDGERMRHPAHMFRKDSVKPSRADEKLYRKALKFRDANQRDKAAEAFRALARRTEEPGLRCALLLNEINELAASGQADKARDLLQRVSETIPPGDPSEAYIDFAEATLDTADGSHQAALVKMDTLLENRKEELSTPEFRGLYEALQIRRAQKLLYVGRGQEAWAVYQEAAQFETVEKDADFYHGLGMCYVELRLWEKAKECFLRALRLGASKLLGVRIRYELGNAYATTGQHALALDQYKACLRDAKESGVPVKYLYQGLAGAFQALGKTKEAWKYQKLAEHA